MAASFAACAADSIRSHAAITSTTTPAGSTPRSNPRNHAPSTGPGGHDAIASICRCSPVRAAPATGSGPKSVRHTPSAP